MTQEAGYFCQRNRTTLGTPFDLIKPGYQKNKTARQLKKTSRTVTSVKIKIYWLNFSWANKINVLLTER